MASDPIAVDINEAARLASLSQDSIREAIKRTDDQYLPAKKYGAKWLIRRADLDEWIANLPDA